MTLAIAGTNVTGASTTLGFQGLLDPLGGGLPLNLDTVSLTANVATIPEPATAAPPARGSRLGWSPDLWT